MTTPSYNPAELAIQNKILEIVDAAPDMDRSDLQGVVSALAFHLARLYDAACDYRNGTEFEEDPALDAAIERIGPFGN